jgi:crotonobetainyl-CoA:carnitine CoA-transferase CaiB-like acyl-CoA transferase
LHPRAGGNKLRFAASSAYPTKDGLVQLAASNARQHRRFYEAIGDPEEAKRSSLEERYERYEDKLAAVADALASPSRYSGTTRKRLRPRIR